MSSPLARAAAEDSGGEPQIPTAYRATVVQAPVDGPLTISYTNTADNGLLGTSVTNWPPKADMSDPAAGDGCLVALDDVGEPWIVRWKGGGT